MPRARKKHRPDREFGAMAAEEAAIRRPDHFYAELALRVGFCEGCGRIHVWDTSVWDEFAFLPPPVLKKAGQRKARPLVFSSLKEAQAFARAKVDAYLAEGYSALCPYY